ncbi:hypothetical protein GCM10012286_22890 [Streptomyces lasiicapitis]|uniref:DksA C4-type domain-containing protein n=1 Tax=Streptomyces lasiicapitis TaxID=1923961 RepID=A0ABQ2LQL4_9ACTN|nr:hypothetical protein GCM10012286_22890 [Streptomyces lasiicapitis]
MAETGPIPGDVLEPVRRHLRDSSYDFDVGPGWRQLVLECHQAVVAEFPEYELLAVKQKWGALAFQAFPRPWRHGGAWTDAEHARLHAVTDAFADRSEGICERCGAHGSLRESRRIDLTLCDRCETVVPEHGRL